MAKVRTESRHLTTNHIEIKRIIREYYEQLYTNKVDNQNEMENFLEKHKLAILTQEEM